MPDHLKKIAIIGTGPMAVEYARVIAQMGLELIVVGRGPGSAQTFFEQTGIKPLSGGLELNLQHVGSCDGAIIATGVEQLSNCSIQCLNVGIKFLLVEKPAGLTADEIKKVVELKKEKKAEVLVAYNRRFYSSVLTAKKLIEEEGGCTSFNFEFTEWSHIIEPLTKAPGVKENWLYGNSSHVIDLAFYLGGDPAVMNSMSDGKLSWHPKSRFVGSGKSVKDALFSYQANWEAPGRWGVEVLTRQNRYIFKPLEDLHFQPKGSVQIFKQELGNEEDQKFKPGLFLQTKYWVDGTKRELFLSLEDHLKRFEIYRIILEGGQYHY